MAIKQGRDSPSVMGVESVPPGKCITTNTVYNTYNGRPITQNISVTEPNGKVSVTNVINGKVMQAGMIGLDSGCHLIKTRH